MPPCGGHQQQRSIHNRSGVSSRAPVWGASQDFPHSFSDRIVSSRAPVWGASGALPFQDIENMSFKSCPRVGGIQVLQFVVDHVTRFKSCPRVGGIHGNGVEDGVLRVSSRAPVWGASAWRHRSSQISSVSSRAPVWGASRIYRFRVKDHRRVSSRAPVWGASKTTSIFHNSLLVSSRAPVWGASGMITVSPAMAMFQVVPPCGGHQCSSRHRPRIHHVSSRAPVWGASVILHKKHVANLCKICIFLPNCRF